MLKLTGVADINRNIRCLTVTMESLDDIQVENLQKAGGTAGDSTKQFHHYGS